MDGVVREDDILEENVTRLSGYYAIDMYHKLNVDRHRADREKEAIESRDGRCLSLIASKPYCGLSIGRS